MEHKKEQLYRVDADLFLRLYPGHTIGQKDDAWDILGTNHTNESTSLFIDKVLQHTVYWNYPQQLHLLKARNEVE